MLLISFWQVLVFLVAFLSLKQTKSEGEFCAIHDNASWSSNAWKFWALEHFIAFAKLGNRLPSQSEMQGRKTEKEIQHVAISHGYAKFSHSYAKFSHGYAKFSQSMRNAQKEYKLQDREQDCEELILHPVQNFANLAKILLCNFQIFLHRLR